MVDDGTTERTVHKAEVDDAEIKKMRWRGMSDGDQLPRGVKSERERIREKNRRLY